MTEPLASLPDVLQAFKGSCQRAGTQLLRGLQPCAVGATGAGGVSAVPVPVSGCRPGPVFPADVREAQRAVRCAGCRRFQRYFRTCRRGR